MNTLASTERLTNPSYELANIFDKYPEITYQKKDTIIHRDYPPKGIIFILSGKVLSFSTNEIKQKEMVNNYFLKNSFLNLYSLGSNVPQNQSAVAITKTKVKIIPLLNFRKLLNESYTFQQKIFQLLLKIANQKQTSLSRMVQMSSRQRIFHFLLDYVEDAGQRIGYEWVIRVPFSMAQIGQLAYTSRQTVSTLMNDLKREGLIKFNRRYLIIRDLEMLKKTTV